jgi:hypothetical protein
MRGCGWVLLCILLFLAFMGAVITGVTLWSANTSIGGSPPYRVNQGRHIG